ncbi:hypothetical protein C1645_823756 [Glomus cerebriforme]|uniref:DUF6570 domain-containing protein n=1 Tax=Glomus cerebriforme TaxID=658196 RepID=A0A397SVA3_9GLOM|nr:hypothetical protein C1645_823756 [Glomus cerebriforme]
MNKQITNPEELQESNNREREQRETRLAHDPPLSADSTPLSAPLSAPQSAPQSAPLSANTISEEEHILLQKFCNKMDNIQYNTCPVCNERIPLIKLVKGSCRRCHTEKLLPKKFSAKNNMDPGEAPEKLKGLTEIEEMLIVQVFTVMTVYRLRGGQNGYMGNIINFPQDIQGFTN